MKKKPARKGRFFSCSERAAHPLPNAAERDPRARSRGISPCRTPRKRVVWQDPGVLFPCGSASASLFYAAKLRERGAFSCGAGFACERRFSSSRSGRSHACGTPVFRPGMGEVAAQRAGGTRPFLRRNAAFLHAAAAGIMRTGTPVFRPGMGEVAAQRAGGTRPFLRRCAASLHAAASAAAVRGTDCKIFQKTAKRSEKKLTPRGDCAKL